MSKDDRIKGVLSPVITPFKADLSPDSGRFIAHCEWLLSQNCGLAVFGTNSEANSLSVDERLALLDSLVDAGVDPRRMMPGTGCCALTDTVRLTQHAVKAGCSGVLMLPPFYYKDVTEEGLFRTFAEVIERVGDSRLRVYLYHIPPVAMVGITPRLVERLLKAYPTAVAGMKDSSGDWNNTSTFLAEFSNQGFDVFVGSENFLLANMRAGGAGCISATANVNPAMIDKLYREWKNPDADQQQQRLVDTRKAAGKYVMIAGLKAIVANFLRDEEWSRVRAPLIPLTPDQAATVVADLQALGFEMPGLRKKSVAA